MYNKSLDIFKSVADNGSFSKAANQLFLTHTAVIKQINLLELHLGVKIFNRTNRGITLTPAGQVLYAETIQLMKLSNLAISRIQEAHLASTKILLIGTSTLYPCQVFMDLWNTISTTYPHFQLKIVSFDNDAHRLDLLNDSFDFLVGPFNAQIKDKGYHFIPLGSYRFCLSLNRNHHLARHKSLSFKDLSGENIRIMKPGYSSINDQIRQLILDNYPDIHIVDINPSYDVSTFNQCAQSQDLLLSLECWENSHLSLKTIPLKEEFYLPYGIVASDKLSATMKEFISIAEKTLENQKANNKS